MTYQYVIIVSHYNRSGRIEQGYPLFDFIRIFETGVCILTQDQVQHLDEVITTRYLFIALPTRLHKDDLTRIKAQHTCYFEYFDGTWLNWHDTPKNIRNLSSYYFKTSRESSQLDSYHIGLLPLCFKPLPSYLFWRRKPLIKRPHDVFFIGVPTSLPEKNDYYHQRIEWLREIQGKVNLYGGLIDHPHYPRASFEQKFGSLSDLYFKHKSIDRGWYFWHMKRSRIALIPAGHSRWTYRHYEALLSGSVPVSTDLGAMELFIPLPKEHMLIVKDHSPVLPTIQKTLKHIADYQNQVELHCDTLNTYLKNGDYHSSKPLSYDQFTSQLPH